jgi:hypothetical protein
LNILNFMRSATTLKGFNIIASANSLTSM